MTRLVPLVAAISALTMAACGSGAAPGPASTAPSVAPATASAKPAGSAGAASGAASAKPAASAAANVPASAKPAASGLTKVKAAYSQTSAVQGEMYVAVDLGIFAKHGIDIDLTQVAGTAQVPAMVAGELQFGTPGGNELVNSILGGAPIVAIGVNSNYPMLSLYGGKGVTDLKDVVGKSVAVTSAGSTTDAGAHVFLKHFGLDKQVKYQAAQTNEGVLAVLQRGDAAAGVFSPPTTIIASNAGLKELVNGPELGDPFVHAAISVTRDYLKANPDTVKRFMEAYLEGWAYAINPANADQMTKTIAKWTKSDEATAKASYDYVLKGWSKDKVPAVSEKGMETVMSIVDNPKVASAKPSDFYDNSLINSLAK